MAPTFWNGSHPCVTESTVNATTQPEDFESSHQALLYIVVTLLFYSIGIIIGIITYLKRERQEIEEDKVFDDLLMLRKDPYQAFRSEQVQAVAAHLQMLEERHHNLATDPNDRLRRPSSLKLGLDVKSSFPFVSRTPSPRINYNTCPKCKKSYRSRFGSYVDRVQHTSHKKKHRASDESCEKNILHHCSPEIDSSMPLKTANIIESKRESTNIDDLQTLDVMRSRTPSSVCNKSIDEIFYTPPDSHPGLSLTRQSEFDDSSEDIHTMDESLQSSSHCMETNV